MGMVWKLLLLLLFGKNNSCTSLYDFTSRLGRMYITIFFVSLVKVVKKRDRFIVFLKRAKFSLTATLVFLKFSSANGVCAHSSRGNLLPRPSENWENELVVG